MKRVVFLLILLFPMMAVAQVKASDVTGKWITEEVKSVVEIYEKDGKYYGKIIWLKDSNGDDGLPKKDKENPDASLRNRSISGLVVMSGFTFNGKSWEGGTVYDPESGNTYSGNMKLRSADVLDLRGYMGVSLLGRTATWYRKK
jgi:uncharacterized protein (DUF2147 family)